MITRSICALTAVLLLAACGGGGGGMSVAPSEPPTFITAHSTDEDGFIAANFIAAITRPAFGSVTQSSNRNAAGVSTDSAQSSFDGDTYTLRIARRNGSTLSLNSNDHQVGSESQTSSSTGREITVEHLLDYDARSITVALGAVEFDPGFGGWMSRGYWIHLTGNWAEGEASDVEVGAFVDGPEFSGSASVPDIGTATYEGVATGLFSKKQETSSPDFSNPGTRRRLSVGLSGLGRGRPGLRRGGRFGARCSARALAGGLSGAVPLLLQGWVRLSRLRCGGG